MDFTLETNNRLQVVFYETTYLVESFSDLKTKIDNLFENYTLPIDYHTRLSKCRKQDDWGEVYRKVDSYFNNLTEISQSNLDVLDPKVQKMNVDIQFSLDQLVSFIEKYDDAVTSAQKYHNKFLAILDSYKIPQNCESHIPNEFTELREDMEETIEKFKLSYNTSEIKGSKLKGILYGAMY